MKNLKRTLITFLKRLFHRKHKKVVLKDKLGVKQK